MFNQIQAISAGYKERVQFALEAEQALLPGELLRLTGPAIFLDRVSKNGRRYIPESVHLQVAELQKRIEKKALFGELDHPPVDDINRLAYVKMTEVSHRIDAIWLDEKTNTYYITVTVLDTPNGRILKSIYDAGSPLYVSLRSLLDPSLNVQRNGYTDAWMMALITIDFVSNPGFSDAELKALDISNESALAVCEALNVFSTHKIFEDMSKTKNKYIPVIAMESIQGVATEPSKGFSDVVAAFLADMLGKFPGKFTTAEFAKAYPDSMYDGHIVSLFEDTAEVVIRDDKTSTVAIIALEKIVDGEYKLGTEPAQYYNTEIAPQSNVVNNSEPAQEMYAIVATEGYEPSEDFIAKAGEVSEYIANQYADGFTEDQFNSELSPELDTQFGVKAALIDCDGKKCIKFTDAEANNGASIELSEDDGVLNGAAITEYYKPGNEPACEMEVGQNVKLLDAAGDEIARGTIEARGIFGELEQVIAEEDPDGLQIMTDNDIKTDTVVLKLNGKWYYVGEGMQVEELSAEECNTVATEAEIEVIDNEPKELPVDKKYMQKGNLKEGEQVSPEIVDESEIEVLKNQEALNDKMYQIVDDNPAAQPAEGKPEEPKDTSKEEKPKDKEESEPAGQGLNELATEAQRIFGMPNSKYAGNYAIEHMPTPYKHLWAGLSGAAKDVIAQQAINAGVACEADCHKFWAKTNMVAVERACLLAKGEVEVALESMQIKDPRVAFLGEPLRSAK